MGNGHRHNKKAKQKSRKAVNQTATDHATLTAQPSLPKNRLSHLGRAAFSFVRCHLKAISCWIKNETLENGFQQFLHMHICIFAILLGINFLIGLLILHVTNTMSRFLPHLICLTVNITITITIGRQYINMINTISPKIENENTSENTELRIVFNKFKYGTYKKINIMFCIPVLAIFFWGIFNQNYITLDLVGSYAVFIVCVAVSISVIGYAEYIRLLRFLYRLSRCKSMHYNKNNPAQTPFLVAIACLTNRAKWCFFVEGFLYVFEYFILIPPANFIIPNIQMPDNTSFFITWVVLLFVIILAFPTIVLIQETLIAKIVSNLKQKQIIQLSAWYEIASCNLDGIIAPTEAFMYDAMITNLVSSDNYPTKIQRIGPATISLATVCLHTITLIGQLPDVVKILQSIGV